MTVEDKGYLKKYSSQLKNLRTHLPQDLRYLQDDVLLRAQMSRNFDSKSTIDLIKHIVEGRKRYPLFFPTKAPSQHFCSDLFDSGVMGYASEARTSKGTKSAFKNPISLF
jgi:hypothetical protein